MHAPSGDWSTEIERVLLSDYCSTFKPPWLDRLSLLEFETWWPRPQGHLGRFQFYDICVIRSCTLLQDLNLGPQITTACHSTSESWTVRLTSNTFFFQKRVFQKYFKYFWMFEIFKSFAVFSKGRPHWSRFGLELKVPFWGYYFYLVLFLSSVIIVNQ